MMSYVKCHWLMQRSLSSLLVLLAVLLTRRCPLFGSAERLIPQSGWYVMLAWRSGAFVLVVMRILKNSYASSGASGSFCSSMVCPASKLRSMRSLALASSLYVPVLAVNGWCFVPSMRMLGRLVVRIFWSVVFISGSLQCLLLQLSSRPSRGMSGWLLIQSMVRFSRRVPVFSAVVILLASSIIFLSLTGVFMA